MNTTCFMTFYFRGGGNRDKLLCMNTTIRFFRPLETCCVDQIELIYGISLSLLAKCLPFYSISC